MALPESFAKDGLGTNVYFPSQPEALYFIEVKVKLPGWDKRGGIDITNLRNQKVTTQLDKTLAKANEMTIVAQVSTMRGYHMNSASMLEMFGFNQLIYFRSPPNLLGLKALYNTYGWLDKCESHEVAEGEEPLWDLSILISNTTLAGAEYPTTFVQMV